MCRAFFCTKQCKWNDVTPYFAMLSIDWVCDMNNEQFGVRLRTKSLWEEVFARHQECDNLIHLERSHTSILSASRPSANALHRR